MTITGKIQKSGWSLENHDLLGALLCLGVVAIAFRREPKWPHLTLLLDQLGDHEGGTNELG